MFRRNTHILIVLILILLLNLEYVNGSHRLKSKKQIKNGKRLAEKMTKILVKEKNQVQQAMIELQRNKEEFKEELKRVQYLVDVKDIIQLNVGGKNIVTRRSTLTKVQNSKLAEFFNPHSPNRLFPNQNGRYFFDYNPVLFIRLLDQLRMLKGNDTPVFYPPLSLSLAKSFNQMLQDFGLARPQKSNNDVIILNVRGQIIATLRKTLAAVPDPNISILAFDLKEIKRDRIGRIFVDYDPTYFRRLLERSREAIRKINQRTLTTQRTRRLKKITTKGKIKLHPTPSPKQRFTTELYEYPTTKSNTIKQTSTVMQILDNASPQNIDDDLHSSTMTPNMNLFTSDDHGTPTREEATSLTEDITMAIFETTTTQQESYWLSTDQSVHSQTSPILSSIQEDAERITYFPERTTIPMKLPITLMSRLEKTDSIKGTTITPTPNTVSLEEQNPSDTITTTDNVSEISTLSNVPIGINIGNEVTMQIFPLTAVNTINEDAMESSTPGEVNTANENAMESTTPDGINTANEDPIQSSTSGEVNTAIEDAIRSSTPGEVNTANEDAMESSTPTKVNVGEEHPTENPATKMNIMTDFSVEATSNTIENSIVNSTLQSLESTFTDELSSIENMSKNTVTMLDTKNSNEDIPTTAVEDLITMMNNSTHDTNKNDNNRRNKSMEKYGDSELPVTKL